MELVGVFAAALLFYGATLAPTLIWGDSAWFTLFAKLGIGRGLSTAGDHPLYLALARLFVRLPGDPSRNLAFESALFGALAVMLVYGISRQLGASRVASLAGAGALCVSHAFWLHAVIPEVYTANTFFLLATFSLMIEWSQNGRWPYLAAACGVFTFGLTNHLVLASAAPALFAFAAVTRPRLFTSRRAMAIIGSLVVGALIVVIVAHARVFELLYKLWVGPPGIADYFRLDLPLGSMAREAGYYFLYLAYQFPSVTLLLGCVGIRALVRDDWRIATLFLGTVAVNAGVFIHHTGWESASSAKFVFYIADYAIFSILCALGADVLLRRTHSWSAVAERSCRAALLVTVVLIPPAIYAIVPAAANMYGIDLVRAKPLPYRDNQTYFLNPNKHGYDGARRFGEEALRNAPPSAVIFADYTPFAILRYLQLVEHVRPDVLLKFPKTGELVPVVWVEDEGKRRPTYIATQNMDYYDFSGLTGEYDLIPAGAIVEVRPRD